MACITCWLHKNLVAIALFGLMSFGTYASDFDQLTILTEEYPPYNYKENGELTGMAVDLLLRASKVVGSPIKKSQINLVPWARAFNTAVAGPNTLLFSTSRSPEREALFKWVGPLDEIRIVLLAKKSTIVRPFEKMADITQTVGVVRDDIGEHLILSQKVPSRLLFRSSKPYSMARMLAKDRVTFWAYPEDTAKELLVEIGESLDNYRVAHILGSTGLYYAFSKDVDDSIIAKLQEGLDKIKQEKKPSL
ncbi:MAG: substrate-binding periplasmic protein [Cellvibrionaceae bacterium]